jgi:hypothetical protein
MFWGADDVVMDYSTRALRTHLFGLKDSNFLRKAFRE